MRKKLRNKWTVDTRSAWLLSIVNCQLIILLIFLAGCSSTETAHNDEYTCPMHPTVVSDKPGVCPVCAMDLVRKVRPGEEVKITEDLSRLIKSTNEVVVANVKTIRGEYKSMPVQLTLKGVVTYDERQVYTLSSRIGGRLEKVYIRYVFQPIRKGQKIAEVYSAELVSAQREYLYLLKHDPDNHALIEAAHRKLSLLGMTDVQLNELKASQEITYTFAVYSPYSGYVISETQTAPVAAAVATSSPSMSGGGMGMGGTKGSGGAVSVASASPGELIRAGSYVSAGQTLFRIVNTDRLWIQFNVPVNQAGKLKVSDPLEVNLSGQKLTAKVDFLEPFFTEGEDFVNVRTYVNKDDLIIGQLAEATLTTSSNESLWLPAAAVLDLGDDKIVFVKERGLFAPRKITVGTTSQQWIEIQSGLASGDEVAAEAHYLVDSENFIKTSD